MTPNVDLGVRANVSYRHPLPVDPGDAAIAIIRRADFEAGKGRWIALDVTRREPEHDLISATDPRLSMFYGLLGSVTPADDDDDDDATAVATTSTATGAGGSSTPSSVTDDDGSSDPSSAMESTPADSTSAGVTSSDDVLPPVDCANLPAGPFAIDFVGPVFADTGSEDLAMTGDGSFVGTSGNRLLESDENGVTSEFISPLPSATFGMRFNIDGDLLFVADDGDTIERVSNGVLDTYIDAGFIFPNGIFPDRNGDLWVTDFSADTVSRVNADLTVDVIATVQNQANGVWFDEDRSVVFWTIYGPSQLWRADIDAEGNPGAPIPVADLTGSSDGIAMDECGNAYVVDQAGGGPCRIDRVFLDAAGDVGPGGVEEIASAGDVGNGCANGAFGVGFGDENDRSLFVTGLSGDVYRIHLGVGGAPTASAP